MASNAIRNIEKLKDTFRDILKEMNKTIIGQDEVLEQILVAILCNSNALLESFPGLGKTQMIKTISEVLDLKFSRIQSTPDLMPSDIIGTYIIEETGGKKVFKFQQGPVFANIVLADEINRATPKTQSALLEAMQERQVTVGNKTFQLDHPFFVLATQNPIDQEGTYPLPEAQSDRFLLKIRVDYPNYEDEMQIVEMHTKAKEIAKVRTLLGKQSVTLLQKLTRQVPISQDNKRRALDIVTATRNMKDIIEFGASPRASIGLILAAKAHALLKGRKCVYKEDIDTMAYPILRHRIILNFKAERQGLTTDDAVTKILKK